MQRMIPAMLGRRLAPLVAAPMVRFQGGPASPQGGAVGAAPPHGQDGQPEMEPPKKPTDAPKFLQLNTNDKGITHLQLARAPVNSLSLEFFQELNQWLLWMGSNDVDSSDGTKAIVLSSALPTVFSAGLDLTELYNPQQERLVQFWNSFQETWLIMNSFPKPIIAAITGNSPAGGCILSLGCDYRVMARGPAGAQGGKTYRIGLNETKLGIAAPPWVMPAYSYVLGSRTAERMLQLGETPTADEALKLGLVDAVAEDEAQTVAVAHKEAERFLAIPQQARWMSRDMMRREYLQMLASDEDRNYDTEFFVQLMMNPDVQKNLGGYLQRLKGHGKK